MHLKIRVSTLILIAVFVGTFALYILFRPPPLPVTIGQVDTTPVIPTATTVAKPATRALHSTSPSTTPAKKQTTSTTSTAAVGKVGQSTTTTLGTQTTAPTTTPTTSSVPTTSTTRPSSTTTTVP